MEWFYFEHFQEIIHLFCQTAKLGISIVLFVLTGMIIFATIAMAIGSVFIVISGIVRAIYYSFIDIYQGR
jgi:hypothetical protein